MTVIFVAILFIWVGRMMQGPRPPRNPNQRHTVRVREGLQEWNDGN